MGWKWWNYKKIQENEAGMSKGLKYWEGVGGTSYKVGAKTLVVSSKGLCTLKMKNKNKSVPNPREFIVLVKGANCEFSFFRLVWKHCKKKKHC